MDMLSPVLLGMAEILLPVILGLWGFGPYTQKALAIPSIQG
jgi:hypothetical protein